MTYTENPSNDSISVSDVNNLHLTYALNNQYVLLFAEHTANSLLAEHLPPVSHNAQVKVSARVLRHWGPVTLRACLSLRALSLLYQSLSVSQPVTRYT